MIRELAAHDAAAACAAMAITALLSSAAPPTTPTAATTAPASNRACEQRVLERLYFGLATPWGEASDDDWQRFVDRELAPRFPDGFTVLQARGHWRDREQAPLREPTRVVEVVHGADPQSVARVGEVVTRYRVLFAQQSVLRLRAQVQACD